MSVDLLIDAMNDLSRRMREWDGESTDPSTAIEAADALDASVRRIKKLEAKLKYVEERSLVRHDNWRDAEAREAALQERVRKQEAVLIGLREWFGQHEPSKLAEVETFLSAAPVTNTNRAADRVPAGAQGANYPEIPDGWVLVPREPTWPMRIAISRHVIGDEIWHAALAAAPPAPVSQGRADAGETVRDAAENLIIAIGMGWDLEGSIERLNAALARTPAVDAGKVDHRGHVTRMSDSSFYDERCVLCGATDAIGDTRLRDCCPRATPPTSANRAAGPDDGGETR